MTNSPEQFFIVRRHINYVPKCYPNTFKEFVMEREPVDALDAISTGLFVSIFFAREDILHTSSGRITNWSWTTNADKGTVYSGAENMARAINAILVNEFEVAQQIWTDIFSPPIEQYRNSTNMFCIYHGALITSVPVADIVARAMEQP